MSYYTRGNLAVEIEKRPATKSKKRTVKLKSAIPTSEKLLYLFLVGLVVVALGYIGVRYIQISKYNHEIQSMKTEIAEIQENSGNLQIKIKERSRPDRIAREAEKYGMVQVPASNIHVLGKSKKTPVQAAQVVAQN